MLLLHLVAMPAAARAGLVGLVAATSLAGFSSRHCLTGHAAARVAVIVGAAPRLEHGPCSSARIHAMVIAEPTRARTGLRARLRAEEALARATIRLRREHATRVAVQVSSGTMDRDPLAPGAPDLAALVAASEALSQDPPGSRPAPLAIRSPAVARDDASTVTTPRDRGVRVLAAIAFFLIGLA